MGTNLHAQREMLALREPLDAAVHKSGLAMNAIEDSLDLHPRVRVARVGLGNPALPRLLRMPLKHRETGAARARETLRARALRGT